MVSPNFDRKDKLEDVLNDDELKERLRMHLNNELSNEILNFLDAVDRFRGLRTAGPITQDFYNLMVDDIYTTHIANYSPEEVNIGDADKRDIHLRMMRNKQDNIQDFELFDRAYEETKAMLLRDGFARFLVRLNKITEEKRRLEQARRKTLISKVSSALIVTSSLDLPQAQTTLLPSSVATSMTETDVEQQRQPSQQE